MPERKPNGLNLRSGECLYYGFAKCGDTQVCRECYKNSMGFFAHMAEVQDLLFANNEGAGRIPHLQYWAY